MFCDRSRATNVTTLKWRSWKGQENLTFPVWGQRVQSVVQSVVQPCDKSSLQRKSSKRASNLKVIVFRRCRITERYTNISTVRRNNKNQDVNKHQGSWPTTPSQCKRLFPGSCYILTALGNLINGETCVKSVECAGLEHTEHTEQWGCPRVTLWTRGVIVNILCGGDHITPEGRGGGVGNRPQAIT